MYNKCNGIQLNHAQLCDSLLVQMNATNLRFDGATFWTKIKWKNIDNLLVDAAMVL